MPSEWDGTTREWRTEGRNCCKEFSKWVSHTPFMFSEGTDWFGAARLQSIAAQTNPKYFSYASVYLLIVLVLELGTEGDPHPPRCPGARSKQG